MCNRQLDFLGGRVCLARKEHLINHYGMGGGSEALNNIAGWCCQVCNGH